MNTETDEKLMRLYQSGSEPAFKVLYSRHSGKIYGFLKARLKSEEQVRDVFQEVFIKIHRTKDLYKNDLPLLPWIFTITRTTLIDYLRKEKNHQGHAELNLEVMMAPEMSSEKLVGAPQLRTLLDQLPAASQEVLKMRYIDEKTFQEIATHLDTSSENVRQMVSRGIKKLKTLIGETGE